MQEQQQQTNQWVLTTVQFNLVYTKSDGYVGNMNMRHIYTCIVYSVKKRLNMKRFMEKMSENKKSI